MRSAFVSRTVLRAEGGSREFLRTDMLRRNDLSRVTMFGVVAGATVQLESVLVSTEKDDCSGGAMSSANFLSGMTSVSGGGTCFC